MLTENVLIGEEKENILREYIEKDLLNLELTNDLEVTNVYMIYLHSEILGFYV